MKIYPKDPLCFVRHVHFMILIGNIDILLTL